MDPLKAIEPLYEYGGLVTVLAIALAICLYAIRALYKAREGDRQVLIEALRSQDALLALIDKYFVGIEHSSELAHAETRDTIERGISSVATLIARESEQIRAAVSAAREARDNLKTHVRDRRKGPNR